MIWPFGETRSEDDMADDKNGATSENPPKKDVKRMSVSSRKSQLKAEDRERMAKAAHASPSAKKRISEQERTMKGVESPNTTRSTPTPSYSSSSRGSGGRFLEPQEPQAPLVVEYDDSDSDVDLVHGTDTSEDWNGLALAPGILAKAMTNIIGMSALGVGVVVGKLGSVAPVLNNGGIANSTAFRLGYNALLAANGIFPRLQGEETDFRDTPLLVSNHISYLDGLVLATVLNVPKIIVKDDLKDMPLFGKLCEEIDAIFVDRNDKDSKKKVLEAIANHADEWREGTRPLLIFPEGKTYNGRSIGPFRKGAFVCGKPVRPLVLMYTGNWDPAIPDYRTQGDESVEYTDGEWGLQFLGHLYHSLVIEVLPIYVPSEEEKADPDLYAKNVQKLMSREYHRLKDAHEEEERRNNEPWVRSCLSCRGGFHYQEPMEETF